MNLHMPVNFIFVKFIISRKHQFIYYFCFYELDFVEGSCHKQKYVLHILFLFNCVTYNIGQQRFL